MEDYWARSGGLLAEWPLSTSGGVFPLTRLALVCGQLAVNDAAIALANRRLSPRPDLLASPQVALRHERPRLPS